MALFANPTSAVAFARDVRSNVESLYLELKSVIHVGRVELLAGIPLGREIAAAGALIGKATPNKITLTPAAAAVLEHDDDCEIAQLQARG